ncbi:MAG: PA3496 family putative envelope integrity protein [Gammaproteobacteria bacterium]
MTKDTLPSAADKPKSEPEIESKGKHDADIEIEDYDLQLIDEYISFPTEDEKAVKKMAARRKIEMYWEKKRLREQLGDFDEDELDF